MFKIGTIINYYDKIGIAIVKLSANLTVGDNIRVFKDGKLVLEQRVTSIQSNYTKIPFAKAKDVVALTLNEKVQKGSEVFRLGQLGTSS